jgi:hypothetical protein
LIFQQSSPQLQTQFSIVEHTMKGHSRASIGSEAPGITNMTAAAATVFCELLGRAAVSVEDSRLLLAFPSSLPEETRAVLLAKVLGSRPPKALSPRPRPRAPQKLLASRDKDAAFWVRVQNDGLVPSLCTTSSWPASLL